MLMLHIGKRIHEVFHTKYPDHSIVWFANALHCQRSNIYNIFTRSTIDTAMLKRIGMVLNHDFFAELSSDFQECLASKDSE